MCITAIFDQIIQNVLYKMFVLTFTFTRVGTNIYY